MKELGSVLEEPGLTDGPSSWTKEEASAPWGSGVPPSSGRSPPRGLYPACLRLSRVKMVSMLSVSLRGLQAGRYLPAPPRELHLDSLLVLSASQSWTLAEEELGAAFGTGRCWLKAEEEISEERTAAGREEEEEEEDRGRMMLVMVSLKSLRRLVEDEEGGGLGRCRGTCCSFKVSPGGRRRRQRWG